MARVNTKLPVSMEKGDLASQYMDFVETEEVNENDVLFKRDSKLVRSIGLPNGFV